MTGGPALADDTGFIGMQRPSLEVDDCPSQLAVLPPGYVPWKGADPDRLTWCSQAPHASKPECIVFGQAGEHYARGDVLYLQGDYPGAITEFVQFYCLLATNPIDDTYFEVLRDV